MWKGPKQTVNMLNIVCFVCVDTWALWQVMACTKYQPGTGGVHGDVCKNLCSVVFTLFLLDVLGPVKMRSFFFKRVKWWKHWRGKGDLERGIISCERDWVKVKSICNGRPLLFTTGPAPFMCEYVCVHMHYIPLACDSLLHSVVVTLLLWWRCSLHFQYNRTVIPTEIKCCCKNKGTKISQTAKTKSSARVLSFICFYFYYIFFPEVLKNKTILQYLNTEVLLNTEVGFSFSRLCSSLCDELGTGGLSL